MSMPPLSHFPDLCLLSIFAHLPLVEVIRTVGRVCTNWTRLQRDQLKRRKTLIIAQKSTRIQEIQENPYGSNLISHVRRDDGSSWAVLCPLNQIEFNVVRTRLPIALADAFTAPLMDLLPKITHLTVDHFYMSAQSSISILEQLNHLFSHYSTNLVSLKLAFSFIRIGPNVIHQDLLDNIQTRKLVLFDSIDRLESLRHLTLSGTFDNDDLNPAKLRILSRLSTFTTHHFHPPSLLLASLRQYGANRDDLSIECHSYVELAVLIKLDPQLARRFTCANISYSRNYENFREFCKLFDSLTTLKLTPMSHFITLDSFIPMTMLARTLSQLTKLIHLELHLNLIPHEERPPQLEIAQVPSVRLLTLTVHTQSHHDTERLHLHSTFPHLQVLHFTHYSSKCTECGYAFVDYYDETKHAKLRSRIGYCMRLARKTFRQFGPSLHTIKLDTDPGLESVLSQGLITVDQL